MARKKSPTPPPVPTPERVMIALRNGDFPAALNFAKQLHALTPTPANLAVRKQAIAAAAAHFADRDKFADFNRVMTEAASFDPDDVNWKAERAALLARGGMLGDGLKLIEDHPDPAIRTRVLGFAADRAVRRQSKEFLPDELHAGLEAVLAAFRHYETGNEAAARESLEPIGLRSPFLEWKVLLRGLLAHASGDDARAAENFARLDPARLPVQLAGPYRIAIDPAFKAALSADAAGALLNQHRRLTTGPVVDGLRAVARELGRDRPLLPAFRAAETVVPMLKQIAPELLPRLANCFYHAIMQQGQPDDLPRFRKLFGNPPDDPQFNKLQAIVEEAIDDRTGAHSHWQKFEQWLAANPPGWPASLLARARADVWARMGENARKAAERDEEPAAFGFFSFPRMKRKPKKLDPPPEVCFRRAADLAPDWADAIRLLFESLIEANKPADAEAVVREFLDRQPENVPALEALGNLLQSQGRTPEAAELWLRVLALNPLDRATRLRTAVALLGSARRKLIDGAATDAEAVFHTHRTLLEDQTPAGLAALRSVVAVKLKQPDEAAQLRARAMAVPGARISTVYRMMVDSQLAKLKPADKRAADKLFADEMAKPPTPQEVSQLIAAYDVYHLERLTYRGQKTHEKKLLDHVDKCLTADSPELEFEQLGELLVVREVWKYAKKYLEACRRRFPKNPAILVLLAETLLGKQERPFDVDRLLIEAKRLAEVATEPRHKQLLERIARIQKEVSMPFDLGSFFGDF